MKIIVCILALTSAAHGGNLFGFNNSPPPPQVYHGGWNKIVPPPGYHGGWNNILPPPPVVKHEVKIIKVHEAPHHVAPVEYYSPPPPQIIKVHHESPIAYQPHHDHHNHVDQVIRVIHEEAPPVISDYHHHHHVESHHDYAPAPVHHQNLKVIKVIHVEPQVVHHQEPIPIYEPHHAAKWWSS